MGRNNELIIRDQYYMRRAIELAINGEKLGHRPFGCVIVDELDQTVSETFGTGLLTDPTRHSEVLAIQEACRIKRGLLQGCTIYSTHEPCIMCTGAILHAHLSRVVFGSRRSDIPQLFRVYDIPWYARFADSSHPPEVIHGCLGTPCCQLFAAELSELANERAGL